MDWRRTRSVRRSISLLHILYCLDLFPTHKTYLLLYPMPQAWPEAPGWFHNRVVDLFQENNSNCLTNVRVFYWRDPFLMIQSDMNTLQCCKPPKEALHKLIQPSNRTSPHVRLTITVQVWYVCHFTSGKWQVSTPSVPDSSCGTLPKNSWRGSGVDRLGQIPSSRFLIHKFSLRISEGWG